MVNEKTVEECGIKEGDFLVLMISSTISATKPKETTTSSSANVNSSSTSANSNASANVNSVSANVNSASATTTSANNPATTTATTANIPATTNTFAVNEEAVNSICEMGFPREEVIRALKASFNNPDRAVEYLTNGIPDGAGADADEEGIGASAADATVEVPADLSDNPLAGLLASPQFMQFRLVVQQNPRLLGPLLEQIAQSTPDLFELIKENQEAFMQIMQSPLSVSEIQLAQSQAFGGEDGDDEEGEGEEGEGAIDPTNVIQVTEEEQAAIERLMALGFDRPRVIEAYFACDKNETIAANFLFEHMNDDDF